MEVRPGAVIQTDVAVMNVLSTCGAIYFAILIYEASGNVRAFQVKFRGETDKLEERPVRWVEG